MCARVCEVTLARSWPSVAFAASDDRFNNQSLSRLCSCTGTERNAILAYGPGFTVDIIGSCVTGSCMSWCSVWFVCVVCGVVCSVVVVGGWQQ